MARWAIIAACACLCATAVAQDTEALELPSGERPSGERPSGEPELLSPSVEPTSPWAYVFTNRDRLAATHACVSEASWAGARRTADCGAILQVVMARRHRRETFAEAAARVMPRFFGGRTSRAWVLALEARPIRTDPPGWPYEVPASHYSDSWRAVYARTQRYIDGAEPLPCTPTPTRWFGRAVDHDALARALSSGWTEADCGPPSEGEPHPTVNAFLHRTGSTVRVVD